MDRGVTAAAVSAKRADHVWSEVTWKDGRRQDDAIIDRWCDGPAVLREDAHYGNHEVNITHQLDKTTGPEAAKTVDRLTAEFESDALSKRRLNHYIGTGEMDYHSEGYRRNGSGTWKRLLLPV